MDQSIQFDKVADIYDSYVNVDFDIPFYLKESEGIAEEILELMCGTGRVTIPLLKAGRIITAVDYSQGMLDSFEKKIKGKNYRVRLTKMDVSKLNLNKKFRMIILPFHSFSEIISAEKQLQALKLISDHLEDGGTFILTLQNPNTRLKMADGVNRVLGEFELRDNKCMKISYLNLFNPSEKIVCGHQYYEVFNTSNEVIEKRKLDICFRPVWDQELRSMLKETDMRISSVFGDYSFNSFNEESSNYIIYKITK
jgi:SAM-dependent methyltransferase